MSIPQSINFPHEKKEPGIGTKQQRTLIKINEINKFSVSLKEKRENK
jgi:hypothetical protein